MVDNVIEWQPFPPPVSLQIGNIGQVTHAAKAQQATGRMPAGTPSRRRRKSSR